MSIWQGYYVTKFKLYKMYFSTQQNFFKRNIIRCEKYFSHYNFGD